MLSGAENFTKCKKIAVTFWHKTLIKLPRSEWADLKLSEVNWALSKTLYRKISS